MTESALKRIRQARLSLILGAGLLGAVLASVLMALTSPAIVAGIETVMLVDGALAFAARTDTGATVSSVHAEDLRIESGSGSDPRKHVGRLLEFTLVNQSGDRAILRRRVARVHRVRTGDCTEWRYHVYLQVAHRGKRVRVLFNLNDRSRHSQRMLLGRNWLEANHVIVDVSA